MIQSLTYLLLEVGVVHHHEMVVLEDLDSFAVVFDMPVELAVLDLEQKEEELQKVCEFELVVKELQSVVPK